MYLLTPLEGGIESAPLFTAHIGGSESNVAIGLARLGHRARWLSQLGDDPFGQVVLKRIRGEGVDVEYVRIHPAARTGVFFKEVFSDGQFRVYYYREHSAASRLLPEDIEAESLRGARFVFASGISLAVSDTLGAAVSKVIELAKEGGAQIAFDPNIRLKLWSATRARAAILALLPHTSYFLPGLPECEILFETDDPEVAGERILDCGARTAVIKLGPEGAYYRTEDAEGYVKGVPVPVEVDPVGAGDGFAAGFLSGLLCDMDLPEAVARACAVGAHAVTRRGDIEGLPTLAELSQFIGAAQRISR